MSLIFGVNLCDRIYIAADCRVSHFANSQTNPTVLSDAVQKIIQVNDVIIAVAGSVHLSKYLIDNLKNEAFAKEGIKSIRDNIEPWVARNVDKYLTEGHPFARACLMFGGIDQSQNKIIDARRLMNLVEEFKSSINRPIKMGIKHVLFMGLSAK